MLGMCEITLTWYCTETLSSGSGARRFRFCPPGPTNAPFAFMFLKAPITTSRSEVDRYFTSGGTLLISVVTCVRRFLPMHCSCTYLGPAASWTYVRHATCVSGYVSGQILEREFKYMLQQAVRDSHFNRNFVAARAVKFSKYVICPSTTCDNLSIEALNSHAMRFDVRTQIHSGVK